MRKTFVCDEAMIITIPIGNLRDVRDGQLMPEKFHCVFKDSYKVFVIKGKPKPLGAAQAVAGVFLFTLGLVFSDEVIKLYTLPSVVFVVSGLLSFAAGKYPNMSVSKLSFSLNIISLFWSVVAISLCVIWFHNHNQSNTKMTEGIRGLIIGLLAVENLITLFLIYWLSKAVCRRHYNTLPTILLKQGD